MKKKKIFKWIAILGVAGILIGGGIIYYIFNMEHRDVQSTPVDFTMNVNPFVKEYLADAKASNGKYLSEDGDSKILAITGNIGTLDVDDKNRTVITLFGDPNSAGVSCTFLKESASHTKDLKVGDEITVKGVVRAGPEYDEDMELFTDAIMDDCDIL